MNPKLIKPTIINVMPNPFSPSGISEYFNFSLIPARTTIAKAHPNPAPKGRSIGHLMHAFEMVTLCEVEAKTKT